MATVSTYLNFERSAEAAFTHYKTVFGNEFALPIMRHGDAPPGPNGEKASAADAQLILHVALPILGGHMLMGSDCPPAMGMNIAQGSNVHIALSPDSRGGSDRLFAALGAGGTVEMPLAEMFWGDYFGTLIDRFGVHWMFNCASKT